MVEKNPKPTPTPTPTPTPIVPQGTALNNLFGGKSGGGVGQNQVYLGPGRGKPVTSTSGKYVGSTFEPVTTTVAGETTSIADAKNNFYNWSDAQLNSFIGQLGSYGYKNVSRITAKAMWDMAVDGSAAWYNGSGGTRKVTPEQYLQWNSKGQGDAPALPQKQVYLYDKATIQGLIDDTLSSVLGRKATADENKQFYTAIQGMINEGTVSTTKEVIDKATGKKMSQTTTKPGFTEASAKAMIEKELKTNASEDYLQKKSLDFADFLSQLGG